MSSLEAATPRNRALPIFAATLFLSATLLFAVQPMFAKMVLPRLGGSPGVWSVAMVFFQAMLLAGYIYAHGLTRFLPFRAAVLVHLGVMALALTMLPIALAQWGDPPTDGRAELWLLGLFTASVGLPFFAVAANAPLLQAWFSRTGGAQGQDPYFLYGASNLGSFAALLSYPVLIEPYLTLSMQSRIWMCGFILLGLCIALCGLTVRGFSVAPQAQQPTDPISWRTRLTWCALAFVPSGLLIAVTSHISTDVAAAPFLWVVPLALYLLTFVIGFRTFGEKARIGLARLLPMMVGTLSALVMIGASQHWELSLLLNLGCFFVVALVAHHELYRLRPTAGQLTEFYLWLSFGGVLGGLFTGLIAPLIFNTILEYPLLLIASFACLPAFWQTPRAVWLKQVLPIVLATLALAAAAKWASALTAQWFPMLLLAIAVGVMLSREVPARAGALFVMALVFSAFYRPDFVPVESLRSFFGVHRVMESTNGQFRMLFHGTTLHGAQRIKDEAGNAFTGPPEPATYYYPGGAIAEAIRLERTAQGGHLTRVALIGLGAGSLACYRQPDETWTFYEIDPVVVKVATNPALFRFLSTCAPEAKIVLGDARLTLAKAEPGLDLIVVDAFSSDAIPTHLLTEEAMRLYFSKLSQNGAVVFHISNRHMDLSGVIAATATALDLKTATKLIRPDADEIEKKLVGGAYTAIVARGDAGIWPLARGEGWRDIQPEAGAAPWTDDYSNILSVILRKKLRAKASD